jgi:hypothetical protein
MQNRLRRYEQILPHNLLRTIPIAASALLVQGQATTLGAPRRAGSRGRTVHDHQGVLAQTGFSGFIWSKLLSLMLMAACVAGLVWFQTDDRWYLTTRDVEVQGVALLNGGEIAQSAAVEGWNIFWLRRDNLREKLTAHPWIDHARVAISADTKVRITVEEAPAIGLWATELGDFWISPHGAALQAIPPLPPESPRLVDPNMAAAVPGSPIGSAVETDIVASALALIEKVSGVRDVRYNSEVGLNFSLPNSSLWVYWGDGSRAEEKLAAIDMGRRLANMGDTGKPVLDVRNPDKPTLR